MFSIDALSNRDLESRHEALDDSSIQFSRVRSNRTKIVVSNCRDSTTKKVRSNSDLVGSTLNCNDESP